MATRAFIPIELRPEVSGSNFNLLTFQETIDQINGLLDSVKLEEIKDLFFRRKLMAKLLKNIGYLQGSEESLLDNQELVQYLLLMRAVFLKTES